ncbi:MAG: hypothetical protein ACWA5R_01670 [bacterium]
MIRASSSIIIARSALSYNSWRNEKTEENRNQRYSAFEIMRESAHLQLLVDPSTFASETEHNEQIQGWVRINLMVSLSQLVSPEVKSKALMLKSVWSEYWEELSTSTQANQKISKANQNLINAVQTHLGALE